jgi:hypothetical protein
MLHGIRTNDDTADDGTNTAAGRRMTVERLVSNMTTSVVDDVE